MMDTGLLQFVRIMFATLSMVGTLILCTKLELGDYLGYLEPIMDISSQSCVKTT